MHLVDRSKAASVPERKVPQGFAGWLMDAARGMRTQGQKREARKQMRVVETLALGAKGKLLLVSCSGERFLVGTGGDSVGTIVRVRPEPANAARTRESGDRR